MAQSGYKMLSAKEKEELLDTLQRRFEKNMHRHPHLTWTVVNERILVETDSLQALYRMEATGGEPDVVSLDKFQTEIIYYDCAKESPSGRRSLCYDHAALLSRKEHKPAGSALDMAAKMGIELLNEAEYRFLQEIQAIDTKTSSWVLTPEPIRKLGGALFGDNRYQTVFFYHNGAESYYAARGFRGLLRL